MKPTSISYGDIDDYVEFDDKPEVKWYWKLLCCLCLLFEPKSHTLRLRKKVLTFDPKATQQVLELKSGKEKLSDEQLLHNAVTKIQKIARGRIGRELYKRKFAEAINEIDSYWRGVYQERIDERERQRIIRETRRKFVAKYVGDIIKTSKKFLIETYASLSIQRVWRGYWSRKNNRPVKRRPPPPLRRVPRRHGMDVLRRIWARRNFEPGAGWPGRLDFLQYDMWDYANKPPAGRDYGLKTLKVIVVPRSEREKKVLLDDKNAWVGLPISFCPFSEYKAEKLKASNREMSLLAFTTKHLTPYGKPVMNLPDLHSAAPVQLKQKMAEESLAASLKAAQEMALANKKLRETETDEEARIREKSKLFGIDSSLEAIRSRQIKANADHYFSKLAETDDTVDDDLLAPPELPLTKEEEETIRLKSQDFVPSKGNPRRGARKPLTKSQRNALRENAGGVKAKSNGNDDTRTKYDISKASLSIEEARVKQLQAIAKQNNYSAQRSKFVKIRKLFIHGYDSNVNVKITIGRNRDPTGAVNTTAFTTTPWGQVKQGAESILTEIHSKRAAFTRSQDLDPSQFVHSLVGTGMLERNDLDSYLSVWNRSIYRPKRVVEGRARVWMVRPKQHYKLRYTWLPQPLIHPAASRIYDLQDDDEESTNQSSTYVVDKSNDGTSTSSPHRFPNTATSKTWFPVENISRVSSVDGNEDRMDNSDSESPNKLSSPSRISGLTGYSLLTEDDDSYMNPISTPKQKSSNKSTMGSNGKESHAARRHRILGASGTMNPEDIAAIPECSESLSLQRTLSLVHAFSSNSVSGDQASSHYRDEFDDNDGDDDDDDDSVNLPLTPSQFSRAPDYELYGERGGIAYEKSSVSQSVKNVIHRGDTVNPSTALLTGYGDRTPSQSQSPSKSKQSSHSVMEDTIVAKPDPHPGLDTTVKSLFAYNVANRSPSFKPAPPTTEPPGGRKKNKLKKTSEFAEFVQVAKLKPYHKIDRGSSIADQPYSWA